MNLLLLWFGCVLTITPTECWTVNLSLTFKEGNLDSYNTYVLYTGFPINGHLIKSIVRTERESALLVWKEWYENVTEKGACGIFKLGCFSCPEPCSHGTKEILIAGRVEMKVYGYRVRAFDIRGLSFELIGGQDPPPDESLPVNCLGLKPDLDKGNFSVMNQLRQKRKLSSATFTLYLRPTAHTEFFNGRIILGDVDPTQYTIPLRYVPLLRSNDYAITLKNINIQEGPTILGINHAAVIRTGRHFIGIPQVYFSGLAKDLAAAASKIAGKSVDIRWDDEEEIYMVHCDLRIYLPALTLYLGSEGEPAPLLLTHQNYVRKFKRYTDCTVMITVVRGSEWELPDSILIGNYIEFQPNEMRLGIARLKA
ncbi:hypothetical protein FOL47_009301 [Perkinsus chesapeaki]|uniref:Peptidase A1 domain-containing protein n=1 Tax=Perkinsus chesapeaki TaxID=330153 RepID=A0A7J6MS46_PERCH|nr:hypothetical protein FOL47_009301 [Perkinsus chesapeaki]